MANVECFHNVSGGRVDEQFKPTACIIKQFESTRDLMDMLVDQYQVLKRRILAGDTKRVSRSQATGAYYYHKYQPRPPYACRIFMEQFVQKASNAVVSGIPVRFPCVRVRLCELYHGVSPCKKFL
jgi:hypothetical protein